VTRLVVEELLKAEQADYLGAEAVTRGLSSRDVEDAFRAPLPRDQPPHEHDRLPVPHVPLHY
jgi:hypothetical protein